MKIKAAVRKTLDVTPLPMGWKLLAANKADEVFVTPEAAELARRTEEECQAIEAVAEPTRKAKEQRLAL